MVVPIPFSSSLPRATLQMRLLAFSMALRNWRMATDIPVSGQSGPTHCRKCSDPPDSSRTTSTASWLATSPA